MGSAICNNKIYMSGLGWVGMESVSKIERQVIQPSLLSRIPVLKSIKNALRTGKNEKIQNSVIIATR